VGVPFESQNRIIDMIKLVSCSENGNSVPRYVSESNAYHILIPRWSDRLEAVGANGVVRCYQFTNEQSQPMSSTTSPRAKSQDEVWKYATPERFEAYQNGGNSDDMISHYYDKLLHIARPPKGIVNNEYLEAMAEESAKELIEVCIRFGKTGVVDEDHIQDLSKELLAK
jgi:uncharacterized protein